MKKFKIAALALSALILGATLVSCGGAEKITSNVTVTVMTGEVGTVENNNYVQTQAADATVFGPYDITVTGTTEHAATVLEAVQAALTANEIASEATDDGTGIESITIDGTVLDRSSDDQGAYSWYYTANGVEPQSGRMGTNYVNDGDDIVVIRFYTYSNPEDVSVEG